MWMKTRIALKSCLPPQNRSVSPEKPDSADLPVIVAMVRRRRRRLALVVVMIVPVGIIPMILLRSLLLDHSGMAPSKDQHSCGGQK